MARGSGTSLAPGFRFHPTDEELVRYYLTRKVSGRSFRFDAISEVDVYKNEPWDLPSKSMLKTRDLEWYFFSMLDKKYGNGWRTNRATEKGYWKTTGKDRPVYHKSRIVGMKKTLVYHCGRAPRGQRSNWVMHEYRLTDEELKKAGIAQDAFVLCRIFQKSGPGPKNGERYGAPFVEEEWENDDAATCFPGGEVPVDDNVALGDDAYFDVDDLDKPLDPTEDVPIPPSFYYGETSNHNEDSRDINVYDQKPVIGSLDSHRGSDLGCNSKLNDSPGHIIDPITSYHEYVDESEMMNPLEADYLLDEPYLDVADNASLGSELFLEANDFSNSMKADTTKLDTVDEYLTFFDEGNGDLNNIGSDSKQMAEAERAISDQEPLVKKDASEENEQVSMPNGHLSDANENDGASSSKQISEAEKHKSDMDYPFIKKTGHLLESMSHPSVFAPEFASKDAVLRINSASQSSSSVHVTAGVIRISNFTISDGQTDWPLNKNMDVNIVLSFSLPQGFGSPNWLRLTDVLSSKTGPSALSVFWYFMFFWVLILSISFKVGTLACA